MNQLFVTNVQYHRSEMFHCKKVQILDNVSKLITLTLSHIEIFTVGIVTVYNAHATSLCYRF